MSEKLRIALVGADASRKGWGPNAHLPALESLEGVELVALCTSRKESAAAAAKAYGIERTYHRVEDLVAQDDIDIVSVAVRAPHHHAITMAVLEAGKHVYCEWPVGADLSQTKDMAALAQRQGVVTAAGLQGRHDPVLGHIKSLYESGWLGDVLSVNVTMMAKGSFEHPSREAWEREKSKGVSFFKIVGGHTIDCLTHCFGPLSEISAKLTTCVPKIRMADTGESMDRDQPDTLLFNGLLANGGGVSFHATTVPFHADGWRLEVHGSKGTLFATTKIMPQISPIKLVGAQGHEPLAELTIADQPTSATALEGPSKNIGQAYMHMAQAIREGQRFRADFEDAVQLHTLLADIQRSSDSGQTIFINSKQIAS